MSNYVESKKQIETIRRKNEVMFRMAISHLMDVGIRHLTEENIKDCCEEIMKRDDSHSFMTNEYQCDLVKMAGDLAKIDHIYLLNYISKEVSYDVGDNSLSYNRAIRLLRASLDYNTEVMEIVDAREDLLGIGFEEEELIELGYQFLFDNEEDEEDNY
jgi:hypothetical protein